MINPTRSLPAIGWPPMKRFLNCNSSTCLWMWVLTLPTSVIRQVSEVNSFNKAKLRALSETGAHKKTQSHFTKASLTESVVSDATPLVKASSMVF